MVNYQNGKIYKLWSPLGDLVYIGSTTQKLCYRLGGHKKDYKCGYLQATSKLLFDEYGIENVKIELIENYPCNNKTELLRKEGEHIRANNCVNKCIAGRTKGEEYQDNKEKYIKRSHKRYHNNKTEINTKKKANVITCDICNTKVRKSDYARHELSKTHLDSLKLKDPIKYLKIKAKANSKLPQKIKKDEKKREKITCECGSVVSRRHFARHKTTKKHKNYVAQ